MLVHRRLDLLERAVECPERAAGPFRQDVRIGQVTQFGKLPADAVVLLLHRVDRPRHGQRGRVAGLDGADRWKQCELFRVHVRRQVCRQLLYDFFDSPEMDRLRAVHLEDLRRDRREPREFPPERLVVCANDVIDERAVGAIQPDPSKLGQSPLPLLRHLKVGSSFGNSVEQLESRMFQ
jgi:hypothetical protein